jgi:hypothetical protein
MNTRLDVAAGVREAVFAGDAADAIAILTWHMQAGAFDVTKSRRVILENCLPLALFFISIKCDKAVFKVEE